MMHLNKILEILFFKSQINILHRLYFILIKNKQPNISIIYYNSIFFFKTKSLKILKKRKLSNIR